MLFQYHQGFASLCQYFMLTFTYKLKTFGKGKPQENNNQRGLHGYGGGFGGSPRGHGGPQL
jgi:hypothetical protein